jgi:predicted nucleic acid-binding Zn ribbon protein
VKNGNDECNEMKMKKRRRKKKVSLSLARSFFLISYMLYASMFELACF